MAIKIKILRNVVRKNPKAAKDINRPGVPEDEQCQFVGFPVHRQWVRKKTTENHLWTPFWQTRKRGQKEVQMCGQSYLLRQAHSNRNLHWFLTGYQLMIQVTCIPQSNLWGNFPWNMTKAMCGLPSSFLFRLLVGPVIAGQDPVLLPLSGPAGISPHSVPLEHCFCLSILGHFPHL